MNKKKSKAVKPSKKNLTPKIKSFKKKKAISPRKPVSRSSFRSAKPLSPETFPEPMSSKAPVEGVAGPAFDLHGTHYGENKLVLLTRDPWWVFAYWETTEKGRREAIDEAARRGLRYEKMVLRIYDVTAKELPEAVSWFDIDTGLAASWYVDTGVSGRDWQAEFGAMTREGIFISIIRSNRARTPRHGISDVLDEEWMLPDDLCWKIFDRSGGGKNPSSSDIRLMLRNPNPQSTD